MVNYFLLAISQCEWITNLQPFQALVCDNVSRKLLEGSIHLLVIFSSLGLKLCDFFFSHSEVDLNLSLRVYFSF